MLLLVKTNLVLLLVKNVSLHRKLGARQILCAFRSRHTVRISPGEGDDNEIQKRAVGVQSPISSSISSRVRISLKATFGCTRGVDAQRVLTNELKVLENTHIYSKDADEAGIKARQITGYRYIIMCRKPVMINEVLHNVWLLI